VGIEPSRLGFMLSRLKNDKRPPLNKEGYLFKEML
jgi:hypothetical protein